MPVIVNELETLPETDDSGNTALPVGQPVIINEAEIERLLRHLHERQRRIVAD